SSELPKDCPCWANGEPLLKPLAPRLSSYAWRWAREFARRACSRSEALRAGGFAAVVRPARVRFRLAAGGEFLPGSTFPGTARAGTFPGVIGRGSSAPAGTPRANSPPRTINASILPDLDLRRIGGSPRGVVRLRARRVPPKTDARTPHEICRLT